MAGKIYFCVCEDWSEKITVNSFGGKNRVEEQRYATSGYKTCHGIFDDHDRAQRKAVEVRKSIARNRAARAPQVATQPHAEARHLGEQSGGNPPIDVIDPEQTMTAEEIRAAIKAGMDAERNARQEKQWRNDLDSLVG